MRCIPILPQINRFCPVKPLLSPNLPALRAHAHSLIQGLGTAVLPASCPACSFLPLPPNAPWCTRCDDALPWRPLAAGPPSALLTPLRAALDFRAGPTRTLLHHLKYRNRPELAFALGQAAARRFAPPAAHARLVPVPITPDKLKRRGYNQAERFAAGLASVWHLPVDQSVLVRRVQHQSLTELDRTTRLQEAHVAFSLADGAHDQVPGQHWVLVDDTLTTGATLHACAVALTRIRPSGVEGFCAAWAP